IDAVANVDGSHPLARPPERGGVIDTGQPAALFAGVPLQSGKIALGLGLAYGRLDTIVLRALADLARRYGDATLRLTPWRAVLIPGVEIAQAQALRGEAAALGMVSDADDPRRRIAACVGSDGCASALLATLTLADRIAPLLPKPLTLHVS